MPRTFPLEEMPSELFDDLTGPAGLRYAKSLLDLYDPSEPSCFQVTEAGVATTPRPLAHVDASFPAQMRDAMKANVLKPGCLVLPTARSAIPCADAVRGFATETNIHDLSYGHVDPRGNSDNSPQETERLAEVFRTKKPETVLVIDEFTVRGETAATAVAIALDGLKAATKSATPVGLITGLWYSVLAPPRYNAADLFDKPEFDGGNYIDYENVTLEPLAPYMLKAGQIAANMLKIDFSSRNAIRQYTLKELTVPPRSVQS